MKDIKRYKGFLENFLQRKSVEINFLKKPPLLRCLLPGHTDNNPSAVLYPELIYCPVCSKSYDIFDVAGILEHVDSFPEKIKIIEECLQIESLDEKTKINETKVFPTLLSIEDARKFYTRENLESKSTDTNNWGDLKQVWPYKNKDGYVIGVDARFEHSGKKTIINFWNNNGILSWTNSPPMVYNEDEIYKHPSKPILINEGCKAADAAKVLSEFVSISWSRGTPNAKYVDWTFLENREGYIFPDDDEPGRKAAFEIQKQLPHFKIVKPFTKARGIKEKGADMVEVLEVADEKKISEHIKENILIAEEEPLSFSFPKTDGDAHMEELQQRQDEKDFEFPFRMLGIADDNRAYFIGRHERLVVSSLDSLTQNKLQLLAPMSFWLNEFGYKHRIQWAEAIDFIIEQSGNIDFDVDDIRGRGAWRESDGKICYHDGRNTTGDVNPKRLYLRKTEKPIGIESKPIDEKKCTEIAEIIKQMSFESEIDAMHCLAWSCLSPFAGALDWRPAVLLTGASGTGKTTVVDYVVKKISSASIFSGAETTSAGLRQYLDLDSTAIILEEAECDTMKKKQNREDLFSLMRQSTSDDAPNIVKGSKEGRPVTFRMKNMFMFVAISPEVESIADDNRIFRVNMIRPTKEWSTIRSNLKKEITDENCRAIRAFTWSNLHKILGRAKSLLLDIQDITGKDTRTCYAQSLLLSAYYLIFQSGKSDNEIKKELELILPSEDLQKRNETDEILDRLLDESVFLPESKTTKTLRCILQQLKDGDDFDMSQTEYRETAGRYGLNTDLDGNLYVAINHHAIMNIIQKGQGYQRFLWRHPGLVDRNKSMRISGKTRKCVMIAGVLDDVVEKRNNDTFEEIPFDNELTLDFN